MSNTNTTDLVVKSNDLIEGFMEMTQNQYKFILFLISKINKNDKEFRKVSVSAKELKEVLNLKSEKEYEYLREFETGLAKKVISILYPNGDRIAIPWFGYLKYKSGTGVLEVAFNYHLSPYLLELETNYTRYLLDNIRNLNSAYSIRIYELLKQYENTYTKERIISIEDLKGYLGIPLEQYSNFYDIKRRVLLQSQKELNQKTDISFEFHEIKQARKVIAIRFIITSKRVARSSYGQVDIEELNPVNELVSNFKIKYNGNLEHGVIQNMIKAHGISHVQNCFDSFSDYISNSSSGIEGLFIRHLQGKLKKPTSYKKIPQHLNFEQNNYDQEDFEKFYANTRTKAPS